MAAVAAVAAVVVAAIYYSPFRAVAQQTHLRLLRNAPPKAYTEEEKKTVVRVENLEHSRPH